MPVVDRTGHRYGRLSVIARAESNSPGQAYWLCRCDCGGTNTVRGAHLQAGLIRSCGCWHDEAGATHRMRDHVLYGVWDAMKQRCYNPTHPRYEDWGGRGITVCDRWLGRDDGFINFLADMGERPPDPPGWAAPRSYWTLDRIDNDGNYEPGNVRWASPLDQALNRRQRVVAGSR